MKLFLLATLLGIIWQSTEAAVVATVENENPIIGILAQEMSYSLENRYPGMYKSFIAASYVKFVEGGGARVVPIWIDKPREYYEDIMMKINGILFPGGATWFNQTNGYSEAAEHIYAIAVDLNDRGEYFPLWGTCLGFELLTYLSANSREHRAHCSSQKQPLPLDFMPDFRSSRMFAKAPESIIEILANDPVTPNFHQFCVTQENLTDYGIADQWRVMSDNKDWNGFTFLSTIEHTKYPFYGIQFHPEKNLYEWIYNNNISHTPEAILAAQYFAQFFVDETRRSDHGFANHSDENNHMIYNYESTFTGMLGSSYEQCYLFDEDVDYVTAKGPGDDATCMAHSKWAVLLAFLTAKLIQKLFA
uniref:folate gamma-glutamyl hydrolase n=1 Tax=Lutzomyia longipalpis TaxID=7200 RepID=A0A7G3ACW2_LUTLO